MKTDCLNTLVCFLMCLVLLGYFSLKDYEIPAGNIFKERMTFQQYYSGSSDSFINSRFSRSVVALLDSKGEEFRFSSNGYVIGYLRENYSKGDTLDIYWFQTCHEIIMHDSMDCVEVLGVNQEQVEHVISLYLEHRRSSFIFYSFLLVLLGGIFSYGCIISILNEKKTDNAL